MMFSKLFKLRLRQFWSMAVISGICFFLAGPFLSFIRFNNLSEKYYYEYQNKVILAAEFIDFSTMFFDFLLLLMAIVFGIMTFTYLHKKKEIDFYHSQPISRKKLFWVNYVAGLVVLYVPMIGMYLLMLLTALPFGYGSVISLQAVLGNLFYFLLFGVAGYSIAIFSAQLTGMVATHVAMTALLSVIVPMTAAIWELATEMFRATAGYGFVSGLLENACLFSPITALFRFLFAHLLSYKSVSGTVNAITMTFNGYVSSLIFAQMAIIAVMTAGAFVLYGMRKSEACGNSMVYAITEPILKGYVMFCVGFMAGVVIFEYSSKPFFYFSFVLFAVLSHMVCEVILRKDFKAMMGRKKECGILLVVLFVILLLLRFDVVGFDRYVADAGEVADMQISVNESYYNYGTYIYNDSEKGITDPEALQLSCDFVRTIVEEKLYEPGSFDQQDYGRESDAYFDVYVVYHLTNGKTVCRNYSNVPYSKMRNAYGKLFSNKAFREYTYRGVLNKDPNEMNSLSVDCSDWVSDVTVYEMDYDSVANNAHRPDEAVAEEIAYDDNKASGGNRKLAMEILKAYQLDLMDRGTEAFFDSPFEETADYEMTIWFNDDGTVNNEYLHVPVYECDARTMALISGLRK